jgi:hypothetical protein
VLWPEGSTPVRRLVTHTDVVLYFAPSVAALTGRIEALGRSIHPDGRLWVAWPKRSSRVPTELTDHVVREIALPIGLVDNKVCSLNSTYTALQLVWRVSRRSRAAVSG